MRSSGEVPNPQEWHLIADRDITRAAEAAELKDDRDAVDFSRLTRLVYRCERCDRLHVFWDHNQGWPPTVYAPDLAQYPDL